jgi:hypothetical protein
MRIVSTCLALTASLLPARAGAAGAKAADADSAAPVVSHQPCPAFRLGQALELVVRIGDASELFEPKVVYRVSPTTEWLTAPLAPDADGVTYRATLPAERLADTLEYWFGARQRWTSAPSCKV